MVGKVVALFHDTWMKPDFSRISPGSRYLNFKVFSTLAPDLRLFFFRISGLILFFILVFPHVSNCRKLTSAKPFLLMFINLEIKKMLLVHSVFVKFTK